jgi:hypothetical protein
MTSEEDEAHQHAVKRYEEAAQHVRRYTRQHHDQFAGSWVGHDNGGEYHVAFVRDADAHRRAIEALVPHPEVLHVHLARYTEDERRELVYRISDEEDELAAEGIKVVQLDGGGHDSEWKVRAGVVAANSGTALSVMRERYGDAVEVEYLGTEPTRLAPSEWQRYEVDDDGRTLTLHYHANPFVPFERADTIENDDQVTVRIFDREPLGPVKMPATIRPVTVQLERPLGSRRVIDGTTGRLREPL